MKEAAAATETKEAEAEEHTNGTEDKVEETNGKDEAAPETNGHSEEDAEAANGNGESEAGELAGVAAPGLSEYFLFLPFCDDSKFIHGVETRNLQGCINLVDTY